MIKFFIKIINQNDLKVNLFFLYKLNNQKVKHNFIEDKLYIKDENFLNNILNKKITF